MRSIRFKKFNGSKLPVQEFNAATPRFNRSKLRVQRMEQRAQSEARINYAES